MPMALALTTTSSAPLTLTVATAAALNSTVASSLLIAPTSSISLTPGPSSDPVVSNDSPSDDPLPLGADASEGVSAASSSPSSTSGSSSSPSPSSKGPSRSADSSTSTSSPSSPSQHAGQKTAAQSDKTPKDLLPSSNPDEGQCFGAAGTGAITSACCASLKGALASGAQYCLFEAKYANTWESCVSTATDGNKAQLAVKCSSSRRNRATWAVIALGVGFALSMGA